MKKFAIGCGIVILLLGVAGAGVAYYLYTRIGSTISQFAELSQVPEIERGVRNQTAFAPPSSGTLTEDQVARLVRVQTQVRDHLGARMTELEERYRALAARDNATVFDVPQLLSAYRDLASTWVEAKREQVEALNEVGFSLDEYRWVRDRAYAALGVPFAEIDIARMIDQVRDGQSPTDQPPVRGAAEPSGAPPNIDMVEPFRQALERNVSLAVLGL